MAPMLPFVGTAHTANNQMESERAMSTSGKHHGLYGLPINGKPTRVFQRRATPQSLAALKSVGALMVIPLCCLGFFSLPLIIMPLVTQPTPINGGNRSPVGLWE